MPEVDRYDCLRLQNQLCFPLYACAKEIVRQYRKPLAPLDLTYTQYLVMMALWDEGEPSFIDTGDGTEENYIMLWKVNGRWCYNDSRNDPAGEFWGWRGRLAYVCEFEE